MALNGFLYDPDEEAAEEEDATDDDLPVACQCTSCGEDIRLTEEVFLIAFTRAYKGSTSVTFNEFTADGTLVGRPQFYCFTCWEEQKEALQDSSEDELPIQEADGNALLTCDICSSDICQGETFATETFGELQWSERSPNGHPTVVFTAMGDSHHLCVDCISNAEEDQTFQIQVAEVEDPESLTCDLGKHLRCWRDRSRCICDKSSNE